MERAALAWGRCVTLGRVGDFSMDRAGIIAVLDAMAEEAKWSG
jgi:hypothetical protein